MCKDPGVDVLGIVRDGPQIVRGHPPVRGPDRLAIYSLPRRNEIRYGYWAERSRVDLLTAVDLDDVGASGATTRCWRNQRRAGYSPYNPRTDLPN